MADVDHRADTALALGKLLLHVVVGRGLHPANEEGRGEDVQSARAERAGGDLLGDDIFVFVSVSDLHGFDSFLSCDVFTWLP